MIRVDAIAARLALVLLVAGPPAWAQPGGGRGTGREYDPASETTMNGIVDRVERVPQGNKGQGVHVWLKTGSGEEVSVRLGPGWYLDEQPVKIGPGDQIEVRGSAIVDAGKPAVIAAEVKKGEQTLVLRNAAGVPAWAGRGRRQP